MADELATETVDDLLHRTPQAIAAALEEADGIPDDLVATIKRSSLL